MYPPSGPRASNRCARCITNNNSMTTLSTTRHLQIPMLEGRRHAIDLRFGQAVSRGFRAPNGDRLSDLCRDVAGAVDIQLE
jgi:hypothetical protein